MITDPAVERYLHDTLTVDDPVLREMERVGLERRFPIVGPLVGRLCEQLARTVAARDVFEMGSGFGYSTYWFARALPPGGRVVHTDADPARSEEARGWLRQGGLAGRAVFEVGDAREILTRYPGPFDVVFIDLDKEGYPEALELARPRVRPGGLIITDNVLWSGRVAAPAPDDRATAAILEYTRRALAARDLLTTILPIRDGVAVSLKLA